MDFVHGHLGMSESDFGWWSCSVCGKRGDDWTNPEDFECLYVQETLF